VVDELLLCAALPLCAAEEVPHATVAIDNAAGIRRRWEKISSHLLITLGTPGGRSESFGAEPPAVCAAGRLEHAAADRHFAISGTKEPWARFRFHEGRVRKQLSFSPMREYAQLSRGRATVEHAIDLLDQFAPAVLRTR